MIASYHRSRI